MTLPTRTLKDYVRHDPDCWVGYPDQESACGALRECSCGLDRLLAEFDAPGAQERTTEKNDSCAGLIHPVASPSDGTEPRLNMVSGDASRGDIEIRYEPPDGQNISAIDEVVANDAHVHLERMDRGQWSLIIESKTQRACFMINGKDVARSLVTTQLFWIDPVGSATDSTSAERADATGRSAAQGSSSHSRPSLTPTRIRRTG